MVYYIYCLIIQQHSNVLPVSKGSMFICFMHIYTDIVDINFFIPLMVLVYLYHGLFVEYKKPLGNVNVSSIDYVSHF